MDDLQEFLNTMAGHDHKPKERTATSRNRLVAELASSIALILFKDRSDIPVATVPEMSINLAIEMEKRLTDLLGENGDRDFDGRYTKKEGS